MAALEVGKTSTRYVRVLEIKVPWNFLWASSYYLLPRDDYIEYGINTPEIVYTANNVYMGYFYHTEHFSVLEYITPDMGMFLPLK